MPEGPEIRRAADNLETIIEAYEEFSEFDTAEIGLIEPLRAMRLVYYLAWLMRRRSVPELL